MVFFSRFSETLRVSELERLFAAEVDILGLIPET